MIKHWKAYFDKILEMIQVDCHVSCLSMAQKLRIYINNCYTILQIV